MQIYDSHKLYIYRLLHASFLLNPLKTGFINQIKNFCDFLAHIKQNIIRLLTYFVNSCIILA